ncbi:MAG: response regulator, partial [Phycisphaerae bacterium]|nr:response regulator [Phycisphaerae bacterium]
RAPPQRIQAIDRIRTAGRHLLTLLNDVLDLSKIDAGAMGVEAVEFELPKLLAECLDLQAASAAQRGLALRFELLGPLPVSVRGDPTRIRQILLNLIANALKFTSKGSVTLRCTVADERLVAEIEDTGCGMSQVQATRLFRPFSQADAGVARMHGGTGLGLVISRRLAALMKGSVSLSRTAPGEGSCFRVEVRVEPAPGTEWRRDDADLEALLRTEPRAPSTSEPSPLRGRVLVAEDGRENRQLITIHLERAGAEVTSAEDGRMAMSLLEDAERLGRPFDLLVTDLQMPEMDGIELISRVRAGGAGLPIVVLTAHTAGDERIRCVGAGCDDFVTKPVDRAALVEVCARWIDRRRRDEARYARACTTSVCSRRSPPRSARPGSSD